MGKGILVIVLGCFGGLVGGYVWQSVFFNPKSPKVVDAASVLPFKTYSDNPEGKILGIGEMIDEKWVEYITFKKKSRLMMEDGHPAIVINNLEEPRKTFELGFYNYGPTLATNNEIVEFWIGDERDGAEYSSFSVRSLYAGFGGRIEVRNHADTSAIFINNHKQNNMNYHVLSQEESDLKKMLPGNAVVNR